METEILEQKRIKQQLIQEVLAHQRGYKFKKWDSVAERVILFQELKNELDQR